MLMTISICHCMFLFFFYWYGDHRDLHVLTHSFPTRRSSDLGVLDVAERAPVGEDPVHHAGVDYACDGVVVEVLLVRRPFGVIGEPRSEEHTSELQSLMRISYAVFCLKKKNYNENKNLRIYHFIIITNIHIHAYCVILT